MDGVAIDVELEEARLRPDVELLTSLPGVGEAEVEGEGVVRGVDVVVGAFEVDVEVRGRPADAPDEGEVIPGGMELTPWYYRSSRAVPRWRQGD